MFNNIKQKIIYIFQNRNKSIFKKYFYLFFEDFFEKTCKIWKIKIIFLKKNYLKTFFYILKF